MIQRSLTNNAKFHVAIIMDGNGRWATARALPRTAGHRQGIKSVRKIVDVAPTLDINILTLYAFSSDNWKRPRPEVIALMHLLETYLKREASLCADKGIRIEVIGRRDRLPHNTLRAIREAESSTAHCNSLRLRLAIDYSSRDAIVNAAAHSPQSRAELALHLDYAHISRNADRLTGNGGQGIGAGRPTGNGDQSIGAGRPTENGDQLTNSGRHMTDINQSIDVDLLIRTGGERRLSDFLLWECAYAELYFTDIPWPDFNCAALKAAVAEFGRRKRRFGGLNAGNAIPVAATIGEPAQTGSSVSAIGSKAQTGGSDSSINLTPKAAAAS